MTNDAGHAAAGDEHIRRALTELTGELRLALPGVQVLFAFLLILPFTERFNAVTGHLEKTVYFIAFIASTLAAVFLIAPGALHRLYHRLDDPGGLDSLLRLANWFAILGTASLSIGMTAVVFFVTDVLYQQLTAALVSAGLAALMASLWFGLPFVHRYRRPEQ